MFTPSLSFHFHAMKTYFTSLLSIVAMSGVIGTAASCSDHKEPNPVIKSTSVDVNPSPVVTPERALPPTNVAALPVDAASIVATPTDPFSAASDALDHATRDKASSLTTVPEKVNRAIDSSLAAWKAKGGASTNMSESKLELARTDFTQKVHALTLADEATWKSAKIDALSSLEHLHRAYSDLMTGREES
jgi:hypothetical protein